MEEFKTNTVIVGTGAVGLAIARELRIKNIQTIHLFKQPIKKNGLNLLL